MSRHHLPQPAPQARAGASPDEQSAADTRLHGRWLTLAHVGWILVVLLDAALFVPGVPLFYRGVHIPCTALNLPGSDCFPGQLTPNAIQALQHLGISLDLYAALALAFGVTASAVFFAIGGLIAWRKWHEGMGLFASLVLITFGATGVGGLEGAVSLLLPSVSPALASTLLLFSGLIFIAQWPAFGAFLLTFPTGRFAPRWSWLLVGLWITNFLAFVLTPPLLVTMMSVVVTYGSIVAVQVYRYRRVYGSVERQQTKWLVLSIAVAVGVQIVYTAVLALIPRLGTPDSTFSAIFDTLLGNFVGAVTFVPIAVAIALLRYRLYDIDVIIRRTLVYGTLTALLAALYFGSVLGLQAVVQAVTGQAGQQPVIIVASTLLIAALFNPLRRGLQATIDRRFYRRKYDAARTLATFSQTLRSEVDLSELSARLVAVVEETMQPAHVSLWVLPITPRPEHHVLRDPAASVPITQGGQR
jgi:uncharacterized membrane protein